MQFSIFFSTNGEFFTKKREYLESNLVKNSLLESILSKKRAYSGRWSHAAWIGQLTSTVKILSSTDKKL